MLTLYPPVQPYATYKIAVESPHEIYVEECGNKDGVPALYVHGGPGSGCSEDSRRFFDPQLYRIILFDQRGCGRSNPHAELEKNNTTALISDMEVIRHQLKIKQWIVFGHSWGVTLGLLYAQKHPKHVRAMILGGIFLHRNQDIQWLFGGQGANRIFPEYWQNFLAPIPADYRHNVIDYYYSLLTGKDEIARMAAAKAWSVWEAHIGRLEPNSALVEKFAEPHLALSRARLECHYAMHSGFMEPDQILHKMPSIQHIPGVIIHGRYDIICPLDNAWLLHKAWSNSELEIIRDAGHSGMEPGITDAFIRATQKFAQKQ